ncbi:MAG: hypothetical protein ACKOQ8_01315 [Micrococcales bacterium]
MKSKLGIAGLGLACAACCAPLLVPLLAGTGLAAGVAALSLDAILCGAIAVLALGAAVYWAVSRSKKQPQNDAVCDPAAGCGPKEAEASNSCCTPETPQGICCPPKADKPADAPCCD